MSIAKALTRQLISRSLTVALAESCTAGSAADCLAALPGASRVLWGSFVCYTAAAKVSMLALDPARLERHGLVSGETARDMAIAALEKSGASLAAAVTGIAGPGGDGSGVPPGVVWIATAARTAAGGTGTVRAYEHRFKGSRNAVRRRAARAVLETLLAAVLETEQKKGAEPLDRHEQNR
jgi:PncC family amidohydrolase